MARYYFSLSNDGSVDDRCDGMDLPDLHAAHEHGIGVAQDLARNQKPAKIRGVFVAVLDHDGRKILEIRLTDVPQK